MPRRPEADGASLVSPRLHDERSVPQPCKLAQLLEARVINTAGFQLLVCAFSAYFCHSVLYSRQFPDADDEEATRNWFEKSALLAIGICAIYCFELFVRFESQAGHFWLLISYVRFSKPVYHKLELCLFLFLSVRAFSFFQRMLQSFTQDDFSLPPDEFIFGSDPLMVLAYRAVRFRNTCYRVSVSAVEARRRRIQKVQSNKHWMSSYRVKQQTIFNRTSERLRKMTDDFWCQTAITLFILVHCAAFSFTRGSWLYESTRWTGYTLTSVLVGELYVRMFSQGGAEQFFRLWFHSYEAGACLAGVSLTFYMSFWTTASQTGQTNYGISGGALCLCLLGHRTLRWVGIRFNITATSMGPESLINERVIAYFYKIFGDIIDVPPPNITVDVYVGQDQEIEIRMQKATLKKDCLRELHLPITLRGALLDDVHVRIKGVSVNLFVRGPSFGSDVVENAGASTDVSLRNLLLIFGPGRGLAEAGGLAPDASHWEYENVLRAKAALIDLLQRRLPPFVRSSTQANTQLDNRPISNPTQYVKQSFRKFVSEKARMAKTVAQQSFFSNVQVDILGVTVEFEDDAGELSCGHVLAGLEVGHISVERKAATILSGVVSRVSLYVETPIPPVASSGRVARMPSTGRVAHMPSTRSNNSADVESEPYASRLVNSHLEWIAGSLGINLPESHGSFTMCSAPSTRPLGGSKVPAYRWKRTLLEMLLPPAAPGRVVKRISHGTSLTTSWRATLAKVSSEHLGLAGDDEDPGTEGESTEGLCVKELERRRRLDTFRSLAMEELLKKRSLTDRHRHAMLDRPAGGRWVPGRPGLLFGVQRVSFEGLPNAERPPAATKAGTGKPGTIAEEVAPLSKATAHRSTRDWQWSVNVPMLRFAMDEQQARFLKSAVWCIGHWLSIDRTYRWRPSMRICEVKSIDEGDRDHTRYVVRLWWIYAMQRVLAGMQKRRAVLWVELAWHTANIRQYRALLQTIALRKGQQKGQLVTASASEQRWVEQLQVNVSLVDVMRVRREALEMQSATIAQSQSGLAPISLGQATCCFMARRLMMRRTNSEQDPPTLLEPGGLDQDAEDDDAAADDDDAADDVSSSAANASTPSSQLFWAMLRGDWKLTCTGVQVRLIEAGTPNSTPNSTYSVGSCNLSPSGRAARLHSVINRVVIDGRLGLGQMGLRMESLSNDKLSSADPLVVTAVDSIPLGITLTVSSAYVHCPDGDSRLLFFESGQQVVTATRYLTLGALPPCFVASSQEGKEAVFAASLAWPSPNLIAMHVRSADFRVVMSEPLVQMLHSRYVGLSKKAVEARDTEPAKATRLSWSLSSNVRRFEDRGNSWDAYASLTRRGFLNTAITNHHGLHSIDSDEGDRLQQHGEMVAFQAAAKRSRKKRWKIFDILLGSMGLRSDLDICMELGSLDLIQIGDYCRGAVLVERYRWFPFAGAWHRAQLSEADIASNVRADLDEDSLEAMAGGTPDKGRRLRMNEDVKRVRCPELRFEANGYIDPPSASVVHDVASEALPKLTPKVGSSSPSLGDALCDTGLVDDPHEDLELGAPAGDRGFPSATCSVRLRALGHSCACVSGPPNCCAHLGRTQTLGDAALGHHESGKPEKRQRWRTPKHVSLGPCSPRVSWPPDLPRACEYKVDTVPHQTIKNYWLCRDSAAWLREVRRYRQQQASTLQRSPHSQRFHERDAVLGVVSSDSAEPLFSNNRVGAAALPTMLATPRVIHAMV